MSTLFEVVPGCALRNEFVEFTLGMPICQALTALQRANKIIHKVELLYSHSDPATNDVIAVLKNESIRLIFEPTSQRLQMIEVVDLSKISLCYGQSCTPFSTPNDEATVATVEQAFGATHPGGLSEGLFYAVSLARLPQAVKLAQSQSIEPGYAPGVSSLRLAVEQSPRVSKMAIYWGDSVANVTTRPIPLSCYRGSAFTSAARAVCSHNGKVAGLKIAFTAEGLKSSRVADVYVENYTETIMFGDSPQAVQSALGSPCRVFYKSEDKMRIHWPDATGTAAAAGNAPSADQRTSAAAPDYFFNYFTLGFDVLFDASTHSVKKFVLRTNLPGHYDFAIYERCAFELLVEESASGNAPANNNNNHAARRRRLSATPFTKWDEISGLIGGTELRPIALTHRPATHVNDNPFGATFCYGYGQLIFEVMRNGYLGSVTLFDEPKI